MKEEESINKWPSFDEVVGKIVKCDNPTSIAIAINNPRISGEEQERIRELIGVLSRNPLSKVRPYDRGTSPIVNDNNS